VKESGVEGIADGVRLLVVLASILRPAEDSGDLRQSRQVLIIDGGRGQALAR